ncbi:hypothetical protein F3Y22_tig00013808pilonHSYRG00097 [Hibiscus syriacus]|uniref:Uncharacterized protein n=1 Tax=Hibiscus syriacus TaxID=106335 RepID=A0A6A3C1E7_HIBSY|nr:uncharacterized protein LOC120206474 [Hibiscus syriacus]KAE8722654.1 hypothetical protein F3Y22_tig00013808pilonHSYRG00097 [Hibiscus syriacus]
MWGFGLVNAVVVHRLRPLIIPGLKVIPGISQISCAHVTCRAFISNSKTIVQLEGLIRVEVHTITISCFFASSLEMVIRSIYSLPVASSKIAIVNAETNTSCGVGSRTSSAVTQHYIEDTIMSVS